MCVIFQGNVSLAPNRDADISVVFTVAVFNLTVLIYYQISVVVQFHIIIIIIIIPRMTVCMLQEIAALLQC